jgi:hypothetical protein
VSVNLNSHLPSKGVFGILFLLSVCDANKLFVYNLISKKPFYPDFINPAELKSCSIFKNSPSDRYKSDILNDLKLIIEFLTYKLTEMKILAIQQGCKIIDEKHKSKILKEEGHQLLRLFLSGHIREVFINESQNAVIILECETMERANELLNSLPSVYKRYTKYDLMQINPLMGFN